MILSGKEIANRIDGDIIINPFDRNRLNPNSYNLSLSDELIVYSEATLDMKKNTPYQRISIPAEGLL